MCDEKQLNLIDGGEYIEIHFRRSLTELHSAMPDIGQCENRTKCNGTAASDVPKAA